MQIKNFKAFFCFVLFYFNATFVCRAINIDRLQQQKLDKFFVAELRNNPEKERAIFFEVEGSNELVILYASSKPEQGKFVMRGNLLESLDKFITDRFSKAKIKLFSPLKKDSTPLYEYGRSLVFEINHATCFYVPYRFNNCDNECFVSDLGYFKVQFSTSDKNFAAMVEKIIDEFSSGRMKLAKKVALNRYYLFQDNYFGPVHHFYPVSLKAAQNIATFCPVHKLTMNKHISEKKIKSEADKQLLFKLMTEDKFLLSQDQRLKRNMVPSFVRLNWSRIKETDIGSGQNHMVFLSIGPGINYFDDPWKQPRKNIPCPRIIFDKAVFGLEEIQIFPTFSIEPECIGEKRLQAINEFQYLDQKTDLKLNRLAKWLPDKNRKRIIDKVENALCEYGLVNDSARLRPGFYLFNKWFNGNIVNNEVRVKDGLSVYSLINGVIVPPGTRHEYLNAYICHFKNQSLHWQYIDGKRFTELFVEAPTADDKGFRTAWLRWHLQFYHPSLVRILDFARFEKNPELANFIGERISRIIKNEGLGFFKSDYAEHRKIIELERQRLWLSYLEAFRERNPSAKDHLIRFINFTNHIEEKLKH
jgi:hypothetical protein